MCSHSSACSGQERPCARIKEAAQSNQSERVRYRFRTADMARSISPCRSASVAISHAMFARARSSQRCPPSVVRKRCGMSNVRRRNSRRPIRKGMSVAAAETTSVPVSTARAPIRRRNRTDKVWPAGGARFYELVPRAARLDRDRRAHQLTRPSGSAWSPCRAAERAG